MQFPGVGLPRFQGAGLLIIQVTPIPSFSLFSVGKWRPRPEAALVVTPIQLKGGRLLYKSPAFSRIQCNFTGTVWRKIRTRTQSIARLASPAYLRLLRLPPQQEITWSGSESENFAQTAQICRSAPEWLGLPHYSRCRAQRGSRETWRPSPSCSSAPTSQRSQSRQLWCASPTIS